MDFVVFIHCYKQILPLSIGAHFSKYFIGQLGGGDLSLFLIAEIFQLADSLVS